MKTRDVMVLCYHAVSPRWAADLSVSPAAFDAQIGYLVDARLAADDVQRCRRLDETGKLLAITFDDAFASVKAAARGRSCDKHGAVATVFAPTAFMDDHVDLEWAGIDNWKQHRRRGRAARDGLGRPGELAAAGWEIGSHTCTHPHLTQLDDETARP